MHNKCSTEPQSCSDNHDHTEECCPTQSAEACPIEQAADLWKSSFHQAMREAHVEILKEKIKKAWGAKLDKSADAVLEAMEACWKSSLAKGKAKFELKDKLAKIMMEGK